jgi:hypothetical protein
MAKDHISHPHNIPNKITVSFVLIFRFSEGLNTERNGKRFLLLGKVRHGCMDVQR